MKGRVIIEIATGDYDSLPYMLKIKTWRTGWGAGIESDVFPEEELQGEANRAIRELKRDWQHKHDTRTTTNSPE